MGYAGAWFKRNSNKLIKGKLAGSGLETVREYYVWYNNRWKRYPGAKTYKGGKHAIFKKKNRYNVRKTRAPPARKRFQKTYRYRAW